MTISARSRYYLDALSIPQWQSRGGLDSSVQHGVVDLSIARPAEELSRQHHAVEKSTRLAAGVVAPTSIVDGDVHVQFQRLADEVAACRQCGLYANRQQAVFGVGNPLADWMIIGEAPGAEEDRLGQPFVGRAGKLLDKMLLAINLDRQTAYIANIIKCRPSNNRDPQADEIDHCIGYLQRQIALMRPKMILLVGRIAAQTLLESTLPIGKLRGKLYYYRPHNIPMIATYHPAYLLRSPSEKQKAWQDLLLAQASYQSS